MREHRTLLQAQGVKYGRRLGFESNNDDDGIDQPASQRWTNKPAYKATACVISL